METFECKSIGIRGVWEIGSFDHTKIASAETYSNLWEFVNWLSPSNNNRSGRDFLVSFSIFEKTTKYGYRVGRWHTDYNDGQYEKNEKVEAHDSNYMVMGVAAESKLCGTEFKIKGHTWKSEPGKLYLVSFDLPHRTPKKAVNTMRTLYRWDVCLEWLDVK